MQKILSRVFFLEVKRKVVLEDGNNWQIRVYQTQNIVTIMLKMIVLSLSLKHLCWFCSVYFSFPGEEIISLGLLQLACGASCADSDEFVLVLENCQGYDENSL